MGDLEAFLRRFEYRLGPVWRDGFRVVETTGDCDDHNLTTAYHIAGSWPALLWGLLTFRFVIWRVKSPQNDLTPRHTALWVRGVGWTDSTYFRGFRDNGKGRNHIQPDWTLETAWRDSPAPHKRRWPLPFPWVLLMIGMGLIYERPLVYAAALSAIAVFAVLAFY